MVQLVEHTQHKGEFIDYDHIYTGVLTADKKCKKTGWKVTFTSDGVFAGLLDLNKIAVWYVDEDSLKEVKENE